MNRPLNPKETIYKEVQSHKKYTLELYEKCLEKNENVYGVLFSFRSNNDKFQGKNNKKSSDYIWW